MNPDEKREVLEKILGPYILNYAPIGASPAIDHLNLKALASASIIVPVEVEHWIDMPSHTPRTHIVCKSIQGHHGVAGKAYAIIVTGVGDGDKE